MAKRKSSSASPWGRRVAFKRAMMLRDPLGRELTECLLRMYLERPQKSEREQFSTRSDKLRSDLAETYAVPDIYVLDPKHFTTLQARRQSRAGQSFTRRAVTHADNHD